MAIHKNYVREFAQNNSMSYAQALNYLVQLSAAMEGIFKLTELDEELYAATRLIAAQLKSGGNVLISGPRKTGKTSLAHGGLLRAPLIGGGIKALLLQEPEKAHPQLSPHTLSFVQEKLLRDEELQKRFQNATVVALDGPSESLPELLQKATSENPSIFILEASSPQAALHEAKRIGLPLGENTLHIHLKLEDRGSTNIHGKVIRKIAFQRRLTSVEG